MVKHARFVVILVLLSIVSNSSSAQGQFTYRVAVENLRVPWEIEFGPDGLLWSTERAGIVRRTDLETGASTVLLDLSDSVYFHRTELGMLGFTWHPDFPDSPYVYIASTYGSEDSSYRLVERFTYQADTLVDPVEINRFEPGFRIHQGCRLKIGQDRKLYVTTGDSPGPELAVEDDNIVGKVLRMNLDGSIPDDNPIPGTYTYTKGHRNVQGWVQLPSGVIFTSEHGPHLEDEVNRLVPGGNYGWPFVEGPCDEEWEAPYCDTVDVQDPFWSSGQGGTVAPCGLEYYDHDRYPSLRNSLLLTTLKFSSIYQFRLNESQDEIVETTVHLSRSVGRIRDIAIHRDGRIFFCTSNHDANSYYPFPLASDDRILELIPITPGSDVSWSVPDTLHVKGIPGHQTVFPIPVTNDGTKSMRIHGLWTINADAPVARVDWGGTIVVVPQRTYRLGGAFTPVEPGSWLGRLRVVTENRGTKDVFIKADTWIGQLDPLEDTIWVVTDVGSTRPVVVEFKNTGYDAVSISDVILEGADAASFSVEEPPAELVDTAGTTSVTVRFTPTEPRAYEVSIRLRSNSYHDSAAVISATGNVVSVSETTSAVPLQCAPNPATASIRISVPDPARSGTLIVTDLLGTPVHRALVSGRPTIVWDGTDAAGTHVPAGVYLVTITTPHQVYQSPLLFNP